MATAAAVAARIALLVAVIGVCAVGGNSDAKRLYDDLMSNYNRLIRPVSNHSEKVTVKLGVRLTQIIEIVSQSLTRRLNGKDNDSSQFVTGPEGPNSQDKPLDGARECFAFSSVPLPCM